MVSLKFSTLTTFFLSLFVVLIAGTSSRANDDIVAFLSSTENIVKKQSQSYERLLAQVSVLAKNTFDGKQWDKVRNDLQTANLTLQQTKKTGTETGVYRAKERGRSGRSSILTPLAYRCQFFGCHDARDYAQQEHAFT